MQQFFDLMYRTPQNAQNAELAEQQHRASLSTYWKFQRNTFRILSYTIFREKLTHKLQFAEFAHAYCGTQKWFEPLCDIELYMFSLRGWEFAYGEQLLFYSAALHQETWTTEREEKTWNLMP